MGVIGKPVCGSLEFPVHRTRFDFFDVLTGRINVPLGMAEGIPDQAAAPALTENDSYYAASLSSYVVSQSITRRR